jgi:predicted dehydrogenase
LLGKGNAALLGPLSMKPGESARFRVGQTDYALKLTRLDNALVGNDFAAFVIEVANSEKLTETEKILRLIRAVEKTDAVFIRSGTEYSAAEAAKHLRTKLNAARGASLTAPQFIEQIASRDAAVAATVAGALGIPTAHGSYEALLADPDVDAVYIPLPNHLHATWAIAAAEAGKHVLCEKPLATTVDDAQAMLDACERAGVFLMVALPVRFAPSFRALREAAKTGRLGDLLGATGTNNGWLPSGRAWFTDPELAGGGAIADHTVHVADLLDSLLERQALRVRAVGNRVLHADDPKVSTETGGLVSITYDGGFVATIDCSWSQPPHAPTWGGVTLEVVGTNGTARIDPYAARVGGFDENARSEMWIPYDESPKSRLLSEFIDGVRSGVAPQPDGQAGLRLVRIVAAAQESARTGQPVDL